MKKSSKKIIGTTIAVLAITGALVFFVGSGKEKEKIPVERGEFSSLKTQENYYDFGSVSMKNGKVPHAFKLKNDGSLPVVISKLYTSCMCTSASLLTDEGEVGPFGMQGHGFIPTIDRVVEPGEEFTVNTVFDPAAHGPAGIGRIERVVFLESENGGTFQLGFSAMVTP